MAPAKKTDPAVDFNAIITKDRQRRRNEALAANVFSKGRRQSAPGIGNRKPTAGPPSLASRINKKPPTTFGPRPGGVQKQVGGPRGGGRPAVGNVDAEWTHDLHSLNNPSAGNGGPPRGPRAGRGNRQAQLHSALHGSASSPALNSQFNIVGSSKPSITIRGVAGPYIIVVKNLARDTTAADIESAVVPFGGNVLACSIIAERPQVIAEIEFETREGADNVVSTLNNQSADGNILQVYHKIGASAIKSGARSTPATPQGPRADIINNRDRSDDNRSGYTAPERYVPKDTPQNRRPDDRDDLVDGSYGFENNDRMDTDDRNDRNGDRQDDSRSRGGLYSDEMIGNRGRGRGNSRDNRENRDRGRGNVGRGYR